MSNADFNEFNQGIVEEFRTNGGVCGGMFEGLPMILVTHKGAKSGIERTTPLVYSKDGDDLVVIASKGGAPDHPAWYFNIKANPTVVVEVGTEHFDAAAKVLDDGDERRRLFDQHAEQMPQFKGYEASTSRTIPVIVLSRT